MTCTHLPYLYGLGVIGSQTDAWSYLLPDGLTSSRQLADANGAITQATAYTPWGDTLAVNGASLAYGYLGGIMDAATGLIYVGNGQYYDPSTGRFLTRGVNPDQPNPYVPWQGDPTSLLISPLALLALVYTGKRKRSKLDVFVALMVVCGVLSLGLAGCGPSTPGDTTPYPTIETPFGYTDTPTPGTVNPSTPTPAGGTPTPNITNTFTPSCTEVSEIEPTPVPPTPAIPNPKYIGYSLVGEFKISSYYLTSEDQFSGKLVNVPSNNSMHHKGAFLSQSGGYINEEKKDGPQFLKAKEDFLYASGSVCTNGTGILADGRKISCTASGFEWTTIFPDLRAFETVARCVSKSCLLNENDYLYIPDLEPYLSEHQADTILKVTDTGGGLRDFDPNGHETLDLFVGEGYDPGHRAYLDLIDMIGLGVIPEYVEVYRFMSE